MSLVYEGVAGFAPFAIETIVKAERQVIAPDIQSSMSFIGWSDGGERVHRITIPDEDVSATAIYRNTPPTAIARFEADGDEFPMMIRFDARDSFDVEDVVLTYEWDFGDDSATATGVSVEHEYIAEGRYEVTLTVRDKLGASGESVIRVGTPASRMRGVRRGD